MSIFGQTGGGVLSLEGAYYNYDVGLTTGTHPGLIGGEAYLAQAS